MHRSEQSARRRPPSAGRGGRGPPGRGPPGRSGGPPQAGGADTNGAAAAAPAGAASAAGQRLEAARESKDTAGSGPQSRNVFDLLNADDA